MCIRDRYLTVYKILSKLVDECCRYSKPKQCHFRAWLKRPIFGVHDSQGSAETLVMIGEMSNYHLIAYSFGNISGKNYRNRLMCIEVIVCNVSVVFLRHSVERNARIDAGRVRIWIRKYRRVWHTSVCLSPRMLVDSDKLTTTDVFIFPPDVAYLSTLRHSWRRLNCSLSARNANNFISSSSPYTAGALINDAIRPSVRLSVCSVCLFHAVAHNSVFWYCCL